MKPKSTLVDHGGDISKKGELSLVIVTPLLLLLFVILIICFRTFLNNDYKIYFIIIISSIGFISMIFSLMKNKTYIGFFGSIIFGLGVGLIRNYIFYPLLSLYILIYLLMIGAYFYYSNRFPNINKYWKKRHKVKR